MKAQIDWPLLNPKLLKWDNLGRCTTERARRIGPAVDQKFGVSEASLGRGILLA